MKTKRYFCPWEKAEIRRVNEIIKKDVSTLTVEEADQVMAFCIFIQNMLTIWTDSRVIPIMDDIINTLHALKEFYVKVYNAQSKGDFVYATPNPHFFNLEYYVELVNNRRYALADASSFIGRTRDIWQEEILPEVEKCFNKYDTLKSQHNGIPYKIRVFDAAVLFNKLYMHADFIQRVAHNMDILNAGQEYGGEFQSIGYLSIVVPENLVARNGTDINLNSITNEQERTIKLKFIGANFPIVVASFLDEETLFKGDLSLFCELQRHDDVNAVLSVNYNRVLDYTIRNLKNNGTKLTKNEVARVIANRFYTEERIEVGTSKMKAILVSPKANIDDQFRLFAAFDDEYFEMPVNPKYLSSPELALVAPAIEREIYLGRRRYEIAKELPDIDR